MLLWVIFAFLTAAVLAVILRPLLRANQHVPADDRGFDRAIYRDQLAELQREKKEGLIPVAEAEAAHDEIGRRLLKTDRHDTLSLNIASPALRRGSVIATLLAIPLFVLGFYAVRGSPGLPGLPHAERLANAETNRDMAALIAKVEAHLADHPGDAAGWRALAPAYRSLARYDAAARAYAQALTYGKPEAALLADLGEVLVMGSEGRVTKAAAESFDAALKLDAKNPKARYFHALALFQEGKVDAAVGQWHAMLKDSPADVPWRALVEAEIAGAKLRAVAPELSSQQLAAPDGMTEQQRTSMIGNMVDGLAARLARDGSDLEGWMRLARARMIMGEPDNAKDALDRAHEIFKADGAAITRIEELRKSLSLQ
jgi:cytochrome c-type biogenesis protein CcmH